MSELRDVSLDVTDGVATVTLDRPDVRNVITDPPLVDELPQVCAAVSADPAVRVMILTGRGSAFSAGGNIRLMHERAATFAGSPEQIAAGYRSGVQRLIRAVAAVEVPLIAAVNGPAIGAGFDLALACDLRLASSTARFGETFVNLGLIPGDGGSWLLPRVVGAQRAAELTFTGRLIDAEEALTLGLVLAVHPPDRLGDAALELARTIAAKPPTAVRYAKRLLRRARSASFDELLDEAATLQAILHGTQEHRDAVAAMLERSR